MATVELPDADADAARLQDLVVAYQQTRSSQTFEAILEQTRRLVYWIARPFVRRYTWVDRDEVIAVGFRALWRATCLYRPDRTARFTSYAGTCIRWAIRNHVDLAARRRTGTVSLDAMIGGTDEPLLTALADHRCLPPEAMPDQQDLGGRLQVIVDRYCTKRESRLIRRYYWQGETLDCIGRKEGVCRARVGQIISRGLARLALVIEDPKTLRLRPDAAAQCGGRRRTWHAATAVREP